MNNINILHLVGGLSTGGIERWLLNLASITKEPTNFHIYSTSATRVELVNEFEKKFLSVSISKNNNIFVRLKEIIDIIDRNNIDIIHSHCDLASGYYAFIINTIRPNVRFITHCHSDRRFSPKSTRLRFLYEKLMKYSIRKYSDYNIAVSSYAKESLFPNIKSSVYYCGIPKLIRKETRVHILDNLITNGKILIFHVARFNEAKNHEFILELAQKLDDRFVIVCLGDGEKFLSITQQVKIKEISNIIFMGSVDNVSEYLVSYASLLILPSLWEGLPLTVIESQSLGIKTLVSDNVTKECNIGLVKFIKLDVNDWVDTIHKFEKKDNDECTLGVFDIINNRNSLLQIYKGLLDNDS